MKHYTFGSLQLNKENMYMKSLQKQVRKICSELFQLHFLCLLKMKNSEDTTDDSKTMQGVNIQKIKKVQTGKRKSPMVRIQCRIGKNDCNPVKSTTRTDIF